MPYSFGPTKQTHQQPTWLVSIPSLTWAQPPPLHIARCTTTRLPSQKEDVTAHAAEFFEALPPLCAAATAPGTSVRMLLPRQGSYQCTLLLVLLLLLLLLLPVARLCVHVTCCPDAAGPLPSLHAARHTAAQPPDHVNTAANA
jgi:hypothetical protein